MLPVIHAMTLILAVSSTNSAATALKRPSAPPVIASRTSAGSAPLWVSSTAAVDQHGNLRPEMFSSHHFRSLEKYREGSAKRDEHALPKTSQTEGHAPTAISAEPAPCKLFKLELPRHGVTRSGDDLDALTRDSRAIYRGSVVGIEHGFFAGVPGSLLVVDVASELRPSTEFDTSEYLYVYYPVASFVAGNQRFCTRAVAHEHQAAVGDSILVYVLSPPADPARKVVRAESRDIFFESRGGFIPPRQLRQRLLAAGHQSLDAIVRATVRAREVSNKTGSQ